MKSKNILLGGLWVGPTKPPMKQLFDPLVETMIQLTTNGIRMKLPPGEIIIQAKLVLAVVDLPAKATLLCCKQYNGKFGCTVCLHPGQVLSNKARVYPPGSYELRTHESVTLSAIAASCSGTAVNGIKGVSALTPCLDLVDGVPVDYMHAVLEGVFGRLMKLWFDSCNHQKPFYQGRNLTDIDNQLLHQNPPSEFSRNPRSIKYHLKFWKASELRNFLLYYSLPIFLGQLESVYWHHYALLVCAIHILLSDNLSESLIDAAELMLKDFCNLFSNLYGENNCTHNVHLLSHLVKYVRLWGPLWTHSAFGFENKSGLLKHEFHGTNKIVKQLLFNINIHLTLQSFYNILRSDENQRTIDYLNDEVHAKHMIPIANNISFIGPVRVAVLSQEEQDVLQSSVTNQVFHRLYKEGTIYYSTRYDRNNKRNNTFCVFRDSTGAQCYGQIIFFVLNPNPLALVSKVIANGNSLMQQAEDIDLHTLAKYHHVDLLDKFITSVDITGTLVAVEITNIIRKAVYIDISSKQYLSSLPNSFEYH